MVVKPAIGVTHIADDDGPPEPGALGAPAPWPSSELMELRLGDDHGSCCLRGGSAISCAMSSSRNRLCDEGVAECEQEDCGVRPKDGAGYGETSIMPHGRGAGLYSNTGIVEGVPRTLNQWALHRTSI